MSAYDPKRTLNNRPELVSHSSVSGAPEDYALFQLIRHFVDPGLDASLVLLTARCARCASCTDNFVAYFDRQRTLVGDDVGQMDQTERRISFHPIDHRARGSAESARGIGLAKTVLDSVWSSVVATHLHDDFAVAADYSRRHGVAIGFAGLNRGLRDGYGDGSAKILVAEQLRARHRGEGGGKDTAERAAAKCGLKHFIPP
jgi:hypothetical protein